MGPIDLLPRSKRVTGDVVVAPLGRGDIVEVTSLAKSNCGRAREGDQRPGRYIKLGPFPPGALQQPFNNCSITGNELGP